jgi:hypothetical protein
MVQNVRPMLFVACVTLGACDNPVRNDAPPDLAVPDLAMAPPDMTVVPDFSGILCGTALCKTVTEVCCVTPTGSGYAEACTAHDSCPAGSNPLACDGPEDCPVAPGGCCVTISGSGSIDAGATSGQGSASCVMACTLSGAVDSKGNFSAQTRLCHSKADCNGLMGTITLPVFGSSTSAFDSCCTQSQAGPYTFCAPASVNGVYGVTCPPGIN